MRYRVQVTPIARGHVTNAIIWYRAEAPEQVVRFVERFTEARNRIRAYQFLGRTGPNGLRDVALKVFPYELWYVIDGQVVTVVAVTHFRQDADPVLRDGLDALRLPHGNPTD
ncbi:MAG: type II toxin-antitoxin system RelE/ParE family toxin [Bifidobacteriaceae bacterium]|nr:type II toxin-antitoxin system RelE/ParE family toxin [Bifidobacteriaceae bacterium]